MYLRGVHPDGSLLVLIAAVLRSIRVGNPIFSAAAPQQLRPWTNGSQSGSGMSGVICEPF